MAVVSCTYSAYGSTTYFSGPMRDTLGYYNPLRYRGYVYDQELGLYYLQSRYYNPGLCRFNAPNAFASTGQGLLGNNMFAYCRNNPVSRRDISGTDDEDCFDDGTKEELIYRPEGSSLGTQQTSSDGIPVAHSSGAAVGTPSSGGSGPSSPRISIGPSGVAAAPNPNNEKMERHHIVEQCQVKKLGFARTDIQGNSNLIDLPYSHHRKLSGLYSSKQPYSDGMRVRDWLATKSFEYQYQFGLDKIDEIWRDLYGR